MRNIVLIGGMGSGKTTLADALQIADPTIHYFYASRYAVRIPLTLLECNPTFNYQKNSM